MHWRGGGPEWFTGLAGSCLPLRVARGWICGLASRSYESPAQTRDVFWECLELRDALGSGTNAQMPLGTMRDSTISLSPNQASQPDSVPPEETMPEETRSKRTDYAAWAALDWADQKHAWALQAAETETLEQGQIEATPEAVESWAAGLARRFGGRSRLPWNNPAALCCSCWPSMRTWCCTRSIRPRPAACWIFCAATAISSGLGLRTRRRPARPGRPTACGIA